MQIRIAATMLAAAALVTVSAFAQPPPNPTQQLGAPLEDQVPLFRITVVGRTTVAINYRPRTGATKVDFAGTTLMPRAEGSGKVEGKKGYIAVDARFSKLDPPAQFGPEYLTYVLWAITPEGRATNLGEVQVDRNDKDAHIEVTTELQSFGLILTAEPYFAVTQPSDVVVMENVVRDSTIGKAEVIEAKYELLNRGSYMMKQDAGQLKRKPLEPGAPLDLAEARNAVALARIAGADRFATDTFNKASQLLADAEQARERKRGANAIMMPARQAAQTAEDARLIALKTQDDAFAADQRARAERRETAALDRAAAERTSRQQAELGRQNADNARLVAERDKATADAARLAAERDTAIADAGRAAAESQRLAAERATTDANAARAAAETDRVMADSARLIAEGKTRDAQALVVASDRTKAELRERLRVQLNLLLETRDSARGLIVNLSDVLFDSGSASLKPGAREKLSKIAGVLLSYPDLHAEVEGHTDSVGAEGYNQQLSENRSAAVRDYLVRQNIDPKTVGTSGFGESQPVASNDNAAGRQQNRRVELVVSGETIGKAAP